MTIHKSLRVGDSSGEKRSVLTRRERLERLQKEGRWNEEISVFGVPKVRTAFKTAARKPKKAAATAEGAEGAAAPAGAAGAAEAGKAEAGKGAAAKPAAAAAAAKPGAEKKGAPKGK